MSIFVSEEKKAIADAYRSMMETSAWKDLENYAQKERESSMKRVDDKSASELNVGFVCDERGMRRGIQKLIQYAQQKGKAYEETERQERLLTIFQ